MTIHGIKFPRLIGLQFRRFEKLTEDLILSTHQGHGFVVPTGTEICLWKSENFGYVIIPAGIAPNGQKVFKL